MAQQKIIRIYIIQLILDHVSISKAIEMLVINSYSKIPLNEATTLICAFSDTAQFRDNIYHAILLCVFLCQSLDCFNIDYLNPRPVQF